MAREEFEEYYIEVKGEDLNGNLVERVRQKVRFTRAHPTGSANSLLNRLFNSKHIISPKVHSNGYTYYTCETRSLLPGKQEGTYTRSVLWTLPGEPLDKGVVDRLREISEYDKEMASRVEKYYSELAKSGAPKTNLIQNDVASIERRIAHYDRLIKNPTLGLSDRQLADYIQDQQKAYRDLEAAQRQMERQRELKPEEVIPNFYRILGKAPGEFWNLTIDQQRWMLRKLIESIEIENIAPHVYTLCLKWIQPVARIDYALIYRGSAIKRDNWTSEENAWLKVNYPTCSKLEILQHFPNRTWNMIKDHANDSNMQRAVRQQERVPLHRDLAYNDWIKTSEYSGIDHESEEGQQVLNTLNRYASETKSKNLAASDKNMILDWLLPADKVAAGTISTEVDCALESEWTELSAS